MTFKKFMYLLGAKINASTGAIDLAPDDVDLTGDISVDGTMDVTGAITAATDLTIADGDLTITKGDLTLTEGNATVTLGDLTLTSGDLLLSDGSLTLTAGNTTLTLGDLTLTDGDISLVSGAITASGSVTASDIICPTAVKRIAIPVVVAAGNGGLFGVANPETANLLILDAVLRLTAGDADQTADIGIAADATTSSDTLFADITVAGAALTASALTPLVWESGQYVTGTASGTPASIAGTLYVTYIKL